MSNLAEYCSNPVGVDQGALCELAGIVAAAEEAHRSLQDTALADTVATIIDGLDTFWLLFSGAMVFLMQAGFAMLCAGSIRQKNVKNIMLKNLLDACGGAIGFWTIGFAFAYGGSDPSVKSFIGNSGFCLRGVDTGYGYITFFFQWAFAATAATIVAGTVAERCKMAAYACYSVMLTGFVYPVVVHSIWSTSGFLSAFNSDPLWGSGVVDFAGSGVVHMTGGATALIAAIILGPRLGRFYDSDGNPLDEPVVFQGHSVALQMLGTFLLWFGWYGFNPGSTLYIAGGQGYTAALCAVTTTLAAATASITALFTSTVIDEIQTGERTYDLTMSMNGALAGLVGITAGCSVVTPWASVIIGMIAGWVYIGFSALLIRLRIDDAVDAIPVHFGNGMWGLIAVGLFAEPNNTRAAYGEINFGWFYNGSNGYLLACQLIAILWILGWVGAIMTPFFAALNYFNMFRVDPLEEEVGLDISHHKGSAYDMAGPSEKAVEELEIRRSQHGGKVEVPKDVMEGKDDQQADPEAVEGA